MRAALLASVALLTGSGPAAAQVTIPLGASIQAAVNAAPAGTVFNLADGTYSGQQFQAKSGDQFIGVPGGGTVLNGNGMTSPMLSANGASNVTVSDVTVTNYQTPSQQGAIHTGAGWQLLNVTAAGNGAAGAYIGGTNNLVSGGSYSNNGQEGLAGSFADGSKIIGVTLNNNNAAGAYDPTFEAGGLKITNTNGLTISGSNAQGNNGPGFWADLNDQNWTITGNGAANNTGAGIQYEISHTATITGNLIANNGGSQVYISNSDGTTVSGNGIVAPGTMHGAAEGGGVVLWSNARSDSPTLAENDSILNNTIVGPAATTGAFSVVGTQRGNVVSGNTFEAPGAAGEAAAAQTARLTAQATPAAPVAQQPTAPQTSMAGQFGPQAAGLQAAPEQAIPASASGGTDPATPQQTAASAIPAACTFGN